MQFSTSRRIHVHLFGSMSIYSTDVSIYLTTLGSMPIYLYAARTAHPPAPNATHSNCQRERG
jgi:hypothetical protein